MVLKKINKRYDFLIIGAGITGVFCAEYLLNKYKNIKLALIDKGDFFSNESLKNIDQNINEDFLKHNLVSQKNNHSPKFTTASINKSIIYENYFHNFFRFESSKIGGFANFWGAVLFPFTKTECQSSGISVKNFKNDYEDVLRFFEITGSSDSVIYPNELQQKKFNLVEDEKFDLSLLNNSNVNGNFALGPTLLALDKEKCKLSGSCLYGCPNKAIFSTINKINYLKKKFNNLDIFNLFNVINIKKNNIFYNVSGSNAEVIQAKKILITCGAINSHKLVSTIYKKNLINSNLLHNPYITFPVVIFSNKYSYKKIPLPKYHFLFKKKITGTIYKVKDLPKNFLVQNLPFKNKFLVNFFFKKLISNMHVIVLFFDSSYSKSKIDSYKENTFIRGGEKKNFYFNAFFKFIFLIPYLIKNRIFPIIPKLTKGYLGSDMHYYGTLSNTNYVNNKNGKLKDFDNIYVCDGSLLKHIPSKHPVFNSLVKTLQIIKEL